MSPELLLPAMVFSLTILALGRETWHRRRGRHAPTCPHGGSRLTSVEQRRRHRDPCTLSFGGVE